MILLLLGCVDPADRPGVPGIQIGEEDDPQYDCRTVEQEVEDPSVRMGMLDFTGADFLDLVPSDIAGTFTWSTGRKEDMTLTLTTVAPLRHTSLEPLDNDPYDMCVWETYVVGIRGSLITEDLTVPIRGDFEADTMQHSWFGSTVMADEVVGTAPQRLDATQFDLFLTIDGARIKGSHRGVATWEARLDDQTMDVEALGSWSEHVNP